MSWSKLKFQAKESHQDIKRAIQLVSKVVNYVGLVKNQLHIHAKGLEKLGGSIQPSTATQPMLYINLHAENARTLFILVKQKEDFPQELQSTGVV